MPKRESVLKSVKKNDPLVLSCEWEACNVIFAEMKPFMDHISDHLQLLLNYMNGESAEESSSQPDSGMLHKLMIMFYFLTHLVVCLKWCFLNL